MPKSANETVRGTNPSKILELQKIRCTGWRTGTACTIGTAGFRTDRRQKRPRLPLSRKLFPIYQLIKINSANKAEHGTIAVKSLECFEFCCSVWCSCSASPSGTNPPSRSKTHSETRPQASIRAAKSWCRPYLRA